MQYRFVLGMVAGALSLILGVFAFSKLDSNSSIAQNPEHTLASTVSPDLSNYTPPPGCVLDRIYRRDDQVWSEFLDRAIRPVTEVNLRGEETSVFPIDGYDTALNCHERASAVNPYVSPSPGPGDDCTGDTLRSEEGWVSGSCYGRLRPDIPLIIGEGDRVFISPPLGLSGEIIVDGPVIDAEENVD
jgi:hypothetical protein